MSKQTLYFPHGLYLQELCEIVKPPQLAVRIAKAKDKAARRKTKPEKLEELEQQFVDHLNSTPTALLTRQPRERTIYVTVRPAELHPQGFVVDRVFPSPGPSRFALTQRILGSGQAELTCDDFQVDLLSAFVNLDILVRAGKFMAAAIQLLGLAVPPADSQNLNPLYDFMHWWKDCEKRLATGCNCHGIEDWIREEFLNRERLIDQHSNSDDELRIALPACFSDLDREILFDHELTTAVLNAVRAQRERIDVTLTDRDVVEPALADCGNSAFRNSARWAADSLAENPQAPKWYGYAWLQAKKLAERELLRQLGGPRAPQLPVKQGRVLFQALSPPSGMLTLESAIIRYLATGACTQEKTCTTYYAAKATYATANYYLTRQSLARCIGTSPSQDQRQRAVMGLLRAVDCWVWASCRSKCKPAKRQAGEFKRMAHLAIKDHFPLPDGDWQPKHSWDQQIFDQLVLFDGPAPLPAASGKNPLQAVEINDTLQHLVSQADLSPDERQAILYKHGIESNPPNVSEEEQKDLEKSALCKLKKAGRRSTSAA